MSSVSISKLSDSFFFLYLINDQVIIRHEVRIIKSKTPSKSCFSVNSWGIAKNSNIVISPLGARKSCGKIYLPLNRNKQRALIAYIIISSTIPIEIVCRLNIEPKETDHPKIIKKKVLITNADSPVTTLKSERTLSTFLSSISLDKPPAKNNL